MDGETASKQSSLLSVLKTFGTLIVAAILAYLLYSAYNYYFEPMTVGMNEESEDSSTQESSVGIGSTAESATVLNTSSDVAPMSQDFPGALLNGLKSSSGTANAEIVPMDLLPNNDAAAIFVAENPNGSGNVPNNNYLVAGFDIGMDTHGGSMKNPTLDIRPEPRIEKAYVGPWNNSTYEPDLYRKNVCA